MNSLRSLIVASLVLIPSAVFAQAQPQPQAQLPASAPAATEPAPHRMTMPPGFKMITVNGRNALVEGADETWATTALGKIAARPKAATQPTSYLEKIKANREAIIRQMMADLGTNDPNPLAHGYDYELTTAIKAMDNL